MLLPTIIELSAQCQVLDQAYLQDETNLVNQLIETLQQLDTQQLGQIHDRAFHFVKEIRDRELSKNSIDALMQEYDLSTDEGIALMCLAEAFLRIPDTTTINRLISDKITSADWQKHIKSDELSWVNAANWGLLITGKILSPSSTESFAANRILKKLVKRVGEPVIRQGVQQLMKRLSQQFVMGSTILHALKRAKTLEKQGFSYSYDMLGEAAFTQEDANRYYDAYIDAIEAIGSHHTKGSLVTQAPGISIKLSALHPRYEFSQRARILVELTPKVQALVLRAKAYNIGLTIDAEEADKLDLSLEIFERVFKAPELARWEGFGLAVQAYQKRAQATLIWLQQLASSEGKRIMLRLVKGAYWDTEIKLAQEQGLSEYPVFTRKTNTDLNYLVCARYLLANKSSFYPQFATHNAYTIAAIIEFAAGDHELEFQCLHGMGHDIYQQLLQQKAFNIHCRIYAPVGHYQELLPYLVRRLLENGANTSFINCLSDLNQSIEDLIANPIQKMMKATSKRHPHIPKPRDLYAPRDNAHGINLTQVSALLDLKTKLEAAAQTQIHAEPLLIGSSNGTDKKSQCSPFNHQQTVGTCINAQPTQLDPAIEAAQIAFSSWHRTPACERAACLERAAALLEIRCDFFMALAIREAGKTVPDALAEVREAVDFLRFYASEARRLCAEPKLLPGPTGEHNQITLTGRGVFVCISPWNFPLAIFTGQISAALVTGNCVLSKPSEQTRLIAYEMCKLLHEAGISKTVLQFIPGPGRTIGQAMLEHPAIAGVMFTGSTATARGINQTLAARPGPIVPLIAETGGQNAMIVDSSALPEQVVADVIQSAFGSAGQRCSALRVLFLQEEIADKVISMLRGAMAELCLGNPELLATDVGPVIDAKAQQSLTQHIQTLHQLGTFIYQLPLTDELNAQGYFVAPCAFEIQSLDQLTEEHFGPILHVLRYKSSELDEVIDAINATGFGLTLGIHTRINATAEAIHERIAVGNTYVNRNMIGAVVGVQPFGGQGLSGTGPKAGGPHYLLRLCHEKTLTINTAATGGNTQLMTLPEE